MKKLLAAVAAIIMVALAPTAQAADLTAVPGRTAAAVVLPTGGIDSTANGHESRPALSLSKLYLGYWVLQNGDLADRGRVYDMIRLSDDGIASDLDRRYPQAIADTIASFGLSDSHYNGFLGRTTTSAIDVARFVSAIRYRPEATPIIDGMRNAAPVAADGYPQDFGTSRLPSAQGRSSAGRTIGRASTPR